MSIAAPYACVDGGAVGLRETVREAQHPEYTLISDIRPDARTSSSAPRTMGISLRLQVIVPSRGTSVVTMCFSTHAGSIVRYAGLDCGVAANSPNACFTRIGGLTPLATRTNRV